MSVSYLNCLSAFAVAGLLATSLPNQQPLSEEEIKVVTRPYAPRPVAGFRLQTNLVQMRTFVHDSNGQFVQGLNEGDFQVYDNGRIQKIAAFAIEHARVPTGSQDTATRPVTASDNAALPKAGSPPPNLSPRYIALFFDDYGLLPNDAPFARRAGETFVRDNMAPGDQIAIFTTSNSVSLGFTDDSHKLTTALALINAHPTEVQPGGSCRLLGAYHAYLITEFHSVRSEAFELGNAMCGCAPMPTCLINAAQYVLDLAEVRALQTLDALQNAIRSLAKMPGRRVLVLSSSGFLTQTLGREQDKVVEEALRGGVVMNSLDAKGLYAEVPGATSTDALPPVVLRNARYAAYADSLRHQQAEVLNDPLAIFAEATGGRFFHNNNDLAQGLRGLLAELGVWYSIGFYPDKLKPDGSHHELKVRVNGRPGVKVDARRGYYAPSKAAPTLQTTFSERFAAEVLSGDSVAEVPVEIATRAEQQPDGGHVLRVIAHFGIAKIRFEQHTGRHFTRLRVVTALFDPQGQFLAGTESMITLSLSDATLTRLSRQGFDQEATLQAPPGSYVLRQVVQELAQGRIAASSRPVEFQ
jgi:VWFA-related protein